MLTEKQLLEAKTELLVIVDNAAFGLIFDALRSNIAFAMVNASESAERDKLYIKAQLVEDLRGEIVKMANDMRAINHGR